MLQTGEWKTIVKAYLASISYADYCVGLLLDGLQAGPNNANTIVVLWSDHGWQLGEKLAWRKFTLWERALRVPLIISGPGIRPATSGMPVSLIDLYPTVADLALGSVPAGLDGRSLKRNLLNGTNTQTHSISTWREVAGLPNGGPHFSVRNGDAPLYPLPVGEGELYDHRTDPGSSPTGCSEAGPRRTGRWPGNSARCCRRRPMRRGAARGGSAAGAAGAQIVDLDD